jgi:hypothetical protein
MAKLFLVDKFPAEYASGVYINDRVWAQFSVPIDSSTATYYNFTVNERDTYEPVPGTISVEGISGGINEAVVIFTPTYAFKRDTDYSVLVSTGIKAKNSNDYLVDDTVWYFTTGTVSASGLIGSETIIIPSGVTDPDNPYSNGLNPNGSALEVEEVVPSPYAYGIPTNIPFIALKFNGIINAVEPSGINIADHIHLSARRIFG